MRYLLIVLASFALAACSSGGAKKATVVAAADRPPAERTRSARLGDDREIRPSDLTRIERQRIARAWQQFLTRSPMWRVSVRSIVEGGGAGPYILSENLFRYFFQASVHSKKAEVSRVADAVRHIGEPAVAYFAKPLVTDLVPLGKEVIVEVPDPNDPQARIKKKFRYFQIDDYTRRDAARVLAAIGEPAVPTLASKEVLQDSRPSGRRNAAFALGKIASPAAIAALSRMLVSGQDWQDRAAAAQALGASQETNPAARAALERGLRDPDAFVRKKAEEALAGRSKIPF